MNATDHNQPRPPWGPISTLATSCAVVVFGVLINSAVLGLWPGANDGQKFVLGFSFLVSMLLVVPLAMLRGEDTDLVTFFMLRLPPWRVGLVGAATFIVYLGFMEVAFRLMDRQVGMEVMRKVWLACPEEGFWRAGFIVNVLVLAPLGEEFLFRGFLLEGLRAPFVARRRTGPLKLHWGEWLAVLVASGFWAGLHGQYELPELVALFFMGIVLGTVRLRTRSLWLAIALHALTNAIALTQLIVG